MERFPVFHDDEVDPFGYRFVNDDASFVHSGDSALASGYTKKLRNLNPQL